MAKFFAKIISSVIAFLFMLFPNNGALQYSHLQITNHTNIAAPKIIEAVKARDIDALEAMMCLNIKQNTENLPEKIGELLDSIDGEIIEITRDNSSGSYIGNEQDGRSMIQAGMGFYIRASTSVNMYYLGIMWETANNFAPKETGIRNIGLLDPGGYLLARIYATEGIGEWHD